jgi:hypothetical protein
MTDAEHCFCGLPATRAYLMATVPIPLGRIPICDGHPFFKKCAGTIAPLASKEPDQ